MSGIFREGIDDAILKLESPERVQFHDPYKLFPRAGLTSGMTLVDLGCGTGYFSVPASKIVGEDGTVFAVDKVQEVLDVLEKKIRDGKLKNIKVVKSDLLSSGIKARSTDAVFLGCVFHDVDQKACMSEAARLLRPGGRLVILEWKKMQHERGPPVEMRLDPKSLAAMLKQNGWTVLDQFETGPLHHATVASIASGPSSAKR